jgi:hypothetical protein
VKPSADDVRKFVLSLDLPQRGPAFETAAVVAPPTFSDQVKFHRDHRAHRAGAEKRFHTESTEFEEKDSCLSERLASFSVYSAISV